MNQDKRTLTDLTTHDDSKQTLGSPEASASEAETEPLIHESESPVVQSDESDLRLQLQAEKDRRSQLEAENAELRDRLDRIKFKTQELELILDETSTLIVAVIGKLVYCGMRDLRAEVVTRLQRNQKPPLDTTTIRHHIDELKGQGFVKVEQEFREERFELTSNGRKYYVEKKLS